jgi:acyl-CoA reductase-like NAD-dependent aldehyde dehydrogenase
VNAAGNHPALHSNWLEALALGYRVAVRPSRREPFTPHRLVSALRSSGFAADEVVFLPGDHAVGDEMLRRADRAMAYGSDDVIQKHHREPWILPQGPGRSKIVIPDDVDPRDHVDLLVDSVSRGGGTGCTNTTAIFVDGDPHALGAAIASRLAALPSRAPEAEDAVLPVQSVANARRMSAHLQKAALGTTALLGGDGVIDELGDGSAVLRPAVQALPTARARQTGVELPFPCVWIARWSPSDGIEPLKRTLALTLLGANTSLAAALLDEPTVRNVYVGAHPTHWSAPGVPHDGYLPDFLMESKGYVR